MKTNENSISLKSLAQNYHKQSQMRPNINYIHDFQLINVVPFSSAFNFTFSEHSVHFSSVNFQANKLPAFSWINLLFHFHKYSDCSKLNCRHSNLQIFHPLPHILFCPHIGQSINSSVEPIIFFSIKLLLFLMEKAKLKENLNENWREFLVKSWSGYIIKILLYSILTQVLLD